MKASVPINAPAKAKVTKNAERVKRATQIQGRLKLEVPSPTCELNWQNPWQLMVATILSAQSTDKMINKITPALFQKYPTPRAMADASQEDLEVMVKQSGFFRQKAKNIREASRIIAEEFGGEVPTDPVALMRCPGVARKSSNVVIGTAYGIPTGICVDTHVIRVSNILKLTRHKDPIKIEQDLMPLFPKSTWIAIGHSLVLHGRYICIARRPKCSACPINELCPSAQAKPEKPWKQRAEAAARYIQSRGEIALGASEVSAPLHH